MEYELSSVQYKNNIGSATLNVVIFIIWGGIMPFLHWKLMEIHQNYKYR